AQPSPCRVKVPALSEVEGSAPKLALNPPKTSGSSGIGGAACCPATPIAFAPTTTAARARLIVKAMPGNLPFPPAPYGTCMRGAYMCGTCTSAVVHSQQSRVEGPQVGSQESTVDSLNSQPSTLDC